MLKRRRYKSDKFPWLESVDLFDNLATHGGDTEVIRVGIDDVHNRGSGHFVAHWRWQGFRECIDVDYFHDRQVKYIDGKQGAGLVWNKVEHCQFEDPKSVITPCRVVAKTAELCIKDLRPAGISLSSQATRVGINVVPLKMPAAVKMWDKTVTPPWATPACVNMNSLTTLEGADDVAPPGDTGGWTGWFASSRVKEVGAGKSCKEVLWGAKTFPMTLREAVLACTESKCQGFAWKLRDPADKWKDFTSVPVVKYDFTFCQTTDLEDSTEWEGVVFKDGTATVKPPTTDRWGNCGEDSREGSGVDAARRARVRLSISRHCACVCALAVTHV